MPSPITRILCTEDDTDTRDLIVFVLRDEGFEVVCAESSDDALTIARSQSFDLYLVDSWMPGLSGEQLTKKLREFDSETPILFYSAAARPVDKARAMESGAQGYVTKPAVPEKLVAEIRRLLSNW